MKFGRSKATFVAGGDYERMVRGMIPSKKVRKLTVGKTMVVMVVGGGGGGGHDS